MREPRVAQPSRPLKLLKATTESVEGSRRSSRAVVRCFSSVDVDSRGHFCPFDESLGCLTGSFGKELAILSSLNLKPLHLCLELRPALVTIDQHAPVAQYLDHQGGPPQCILQRHHLQCEAGALAQALGQCYSMVQFRITQRDASRSMQAWGS